MSPVDNLPDRRRDRDWDGVGLSSSIAGRDGGGGGFAAQHPVEGGPRDQPSPTKPQGGDLSGLHRLIGLISADP